MQALTRACELYKGPLIPDAAWPWLEVLRNDYLKRYVDAALQLADLVAPLDVARSDGYARSILAAAPETELAYERLIRNARQVGDLDSANRVIKQYLHAAEEFGFVVNRRLLDDRNGRAAR